jgi:hypothetical protein
MRRPLALRLTLAVAATVAACDLSTPISASPFLTVSPVLDSVFVGDSLAPRTVTLYDAEGTPQSPGPVTWSIAPDTIATIDAAGKIHGRNKGVARVTAQAAGLAAPALVVVSRPLDLTLLMDTVYLMPGDTFTIPLAIQKKDTLPADTVWFDRSPQAAVYTIDTASGLVTAQPGLGSNIPYVAHVRAGAASVSDTGAVTVMQLNDTTGGRFYLTVVGTSIRHEGGPARAMNYTRSDVGVAFRLTDSLVAGSPIEKLYLTLPDSVGAQRTAFVDSLNPFQEAALSAFCTPPRAWAIWSSVFPTVAIRAYSHLPSSGGQHAGEVSITQYDTVSGGRAISGRFRFTAERTDLSGDTLGLVTLHGTFVVPLIRNQTICQ